MRLFLIALISVSVLSCGSNVEKPSDPPAKNVADVSRPGGDVNANATPKENEGMSATAACYQVKTGDKALLKSQTFAIDFEPFRGSCFVTSHDPQFKDPALESEFAIYKDGKKTFDFPNQFNGTTVGCWIDGVAFQDVNRDNRTDVIVVGKCGAKMGDYNENSVYLNDGKTLLVNPDPDYKLNDFKTIKEITDYVQKNPSLFSL